jgi:hypothetical protein
MLGHMDRRLFLKLTGVVAAASALEGVPSIAAAQVQAEQQLPATVYGPGLYQLTGRVRLDEPIVEISGVSNRQQLSWSGPSSGLAPVAGFSSYEQFDRPWTLPAIQVRGGQLQALSVVPIHFA